MNNENEKLLSEQQVADGQVNNTLAKIAFLLGQKSMEIRETCDPDVAEHRIQGHLDVLEILTELHQDNP